MQAISRQWVCAFTVLFVGGPALAGNIIVPPSGDTSGQTDPDNIVAAWDAAGPKDLVVLSDGDPSTVDHYYVNRVMVADNLDHASLVGESEATTILEAIHNDDPQAWVFDSAYIPPCPDGAAAWAGCTHDGVVQDFFWGTPIQGEYLKNGWTMRNLTLRLSDPVSPLDKSDPRTGIDGCKDLTEDQPCRREFQAMAFWGGNGDYEFSHVTIEVMPGTTAEVYGPHVMWGTAPGLAHLDGTGNLTIKDCTIKNAWWGPIIMWSEGGKVEVSDLKTFDVGDPVDFEFMFNERNTVTDSTFVYTGRRGIPERDWDGAAIWLRGTWNADIVGNEIDAPPGDLWSGVFLFFADHDVTIRDNVFTDVAGDPDPETGEPRGQVYVPWAFYNLDHPEWGHYPRSTDITITDNHYGPDGIAIHLNGDDSTIEEPSLTEDQVFDGGTNNIWKLGD